jgi:tyrosine-protein kinase Etk/Wzc
VDDTYTIGGNKYDIKFDSRGTYGEPFKNKDFSFIINKKYDLPEDHDEEYFFVFNDFVGLANAYRANIEISLSDAKSNLISVRLKSANALRAVDYLNTLSRVYIQFGLNEKNQASENTVQFIDSQLSGIVESLQQAGRDFTDFRTQNRIMDLSQEASLIMDRMTEVERSQSLASIRLDYYKNLLQYLGDATQMERMVAPSVVGITDPSLNAMVLSLGELYTKRNALALSVQDKNPTLIALDNEITYTQQSLQENLKSLVSNAEVEIRNLEQNKNKINAQLSKLPKTEQNMVNIKRSFDLNNELYTFLLQKRAEAAIAKASTTPDVKALDIARIENAIPVGSNQMIKLILGLLGGLAVPAVFLIISDYFDNKINKKEDIAKGTSLPLIGVIAHNRLKTEFPVLKNPHAGVTETFRSLRTNLQYLLENDKSNLIAVQSMISGEGKSFVALNLAIAFAINNKKVLVVDGDLRKPQLHYPFNSKNDIGLSTFLMNKGTFEEVIQGSKIDHLTYVTTGPILRNTAELLDSEKLTQFIELARAKFDFIVFNNSPISIVTDGVIVGTHADCNLVILRQGFSLKSSLKPSTILPNKDF